MVAGPIERSAARPDADARAVAAVFAACTAAAPHTPLDALHTALLRLSSPSTGTPPVGWARTDPADPALLGVTVRDAEAVRAGIVALLDAAVARGALRAQTDVEQLARAVHVAQQGSIAVWATLGRGPFAQALRHDVDAALAGHRAPR